MFDWTVAVPLTSDLSVIVHSVSDWSEIPDQCCRSTHQYSLLAQVVKDAEISSPDLEALNASLLLLSPDHLGGVRGRSENLLGATPPRQQEDPSCWCGHDV